MITRNEDDMSVNCIPSFCSCCIRKFKVWLAVHDPDLHLKYESSNVDLDLTLQEETSNHTRTADEQSTSHANLDLILHQYLINNERQRTGFSHSLILQTIPLLSPPIKPSLLMTNISKSLLAKLKKNAQLSNMIYKKMDSKQSSFNSPESRRLLGIMMIHAPKLSLECAEVIL